MYSDAMQCADQRMPPFTLCCVGLVFCSPGASPTVGTIDTCTRQKFSGRTRSCSWRRASTNGMLSMSPAIRDSAKRALVQSQQYSHGDIASSIDHLPMVPPSSITHTSGSMALESTG